MDPVNTRRLRRTLPAGLLLIGAILAVGCEQRAPTVTPEMPPTSGTAQTPETSRPAETQATDMSPSSRAPRPAPAPDGSGAEGQGASAERASAEDFVGIEALPVEQYLRSPRFASADLERGELLSYACRACHALDAESENTLGPNLAGVFGRKAGTTGFDYSAALRESGITWTPQALDAWLAQPDAFIPGNNMAFTGYHSASDRRDLIAYLLRQTR